MYYLPEESFKSEEQKLVTLVLQAFAVEKIYLLGATREKKQVSANTRLPVAVPGCGACHYWLLVLVDPDSGRTNNYVQDKIENTCRPFIAVTVIVLDIVQFNNWLCQGHRFASQVSKLAPLLHGNNKMPPVVPGNIKYTADEKTTANCWMRGMNKVTEFIAGAELYQLRLQNEMATFMLHQASEHALNNILKKATGLHIVTHNINKLVRYCSMISHTIPAIFTTDASCNARVFQLLQQSYIDARYSADFTINNAELTVLTEKVKFLQQVMLEGTFYMA